MRRILFFDWPGVVVDTASSIGLEISQFGIWFYHDQTLFKWRCKKDVRNFICLVESLHQTFDMDVENEIFWVLGIGSSEIFRWPKYWTILGKTFDRLGLASKMRTPFER